MKRKFRLTRCLRLIGMPMVYVGALVLIASFVFGWTNANILLLLCAFVIIVGAVMHVWALKKESKY
ncbi:MAG: hypothetical protein Q4D41_02480 [Prevotellaceae bacterium]|nr:hypothetical protein [Prevotellaceae bacterium]